MLGLRGADRGGERGVASAVAPGVEAEAGLSLDMIIGVVPLCREDILEDEAGGREREGRGVDMLLRGGRKWQER